MKTVCICGSFKFYDEMVDLRGALEVRGIRCEWPRPGPRRDPRSMDLEEARAAMALHFQRMDAADLIFFFNQGGYTGNNLIMELGYAYARAKPVYTLTPIDDPFLRTMVTGVVGIDGLMALATGRG